MKMTPTTTTARSIDVEQWLNDRMTTFESKVVPLTSISVPQSRANQARIAPINETLVKTYVTAIQNGATFPALIAYQKGDQLVLIDGNHRLAALIEEDIPNAWVYVVKGSAEHILQLTYEANCRNGQPASREERILHGIHLVKSGVCRSAREAAQIVGVPPYDLTTAIAIEKATRRACAMGIRLFPSLSTGIKKRLANITSDPAFEAATRLAIQAKLKDKEISELTSRINKAGTDSEKITIIAAESDRIRSERAGESTRSRRDVATTPWVQAKAHLTALTKFDADEVKTSCPSGEVWKEISDLASEVTHILDSFLGA